MRELLRQTSGVAEKLREKLRQALAKMPRLHLAFLFGSYSGKDELGSDLDLFIVGDVDWEQLGALTTRLERDLGREINLVVWTLDQLERPSANQRKFLTNLLSRPRIWLLRDDDELERLRSAVGAAMAHLIARIRPNPAATRSRLLLAETNVQRAKREVAGDPDAALIFAEQALINAAHALLARDGYSANSHVVRFGLSTTPSRLRDRASVDRSDPVRAKYGAVRRRRIGLAETRRGRDRGGGAGAG